MARWYVEVVQLRARDVRKGDVVAKDPERTDGWFRVSEVRGLPDGSVNVLDKSNQRSFTAGPFDLVGLQTPVPLPAEADVTVARQQRSATPAPAAHQPETADPAAANGAPGSAPSSDADGAAPRPPEAGGHREDASAREAVARQMQSESRQVRGSLPSS